ncbi:MAG: hypothetical protein N2444_09715, partial [Methylocystis sp.]|nr:hypothetical protein [Methylocystis sp.]
MTLDELDSSLPNGFHDAMIRSIAIDYDACEARLKIDLWVGNPDARAEEEREKYASAELTLSGLLYWITEAPKFLCSPGGLWIDAGSIERLQTKKPKLPEIPAHAFASYVYVNDWNSFCLLYTSPSPRDQ